MSPNETQSEYAHRLAFRDPPNQPEGGEGEPVAWRVRVADGWMLFTTYNAASDFGDDRATPAQPLYAAPPSSASLTAALRALSRALRPRTPASGGGK